MGTLYDKYILKVRGTLISIQAVSILNRISKLNEQIQHLDNHNDVQENRHALNLIYLELIDPLHYLEQTIIEMVEQRRLLYSAEVEILNKLHRIVESNRSGPNKNPIW